MKYNIIATPEFARNLKRLVKKFPSLKSEIVTLVNALEKQPLFGTPLGKDCYKIRISIASKGKGKSGDARMITHVIIAVNTVYLLTIYDKTEKANLTDKELKELLKFLSD